MLTATTTQPRRLLVLLVAAALFTAWPSWAEENAQEPPTRVKSRDAKELIRGEWSGTTVNGKGNERRSTLTLTEGDFSDATGRFSNWKVLRGEIQGRRGAAAAVVLYAPGTQDGEEVEKPITCVGRFSEDYREWRGEFQGFTQTGTFVFTRQPAAPDGEAVRGTWSGVLTPSRRREADASPPIGLNLLTGSFAQATGVVFRSDDQPPADSVELIYFDPHTREIDLRISFAKPEDRRTKAARTVYLQGVFNAEFTSLEGAYKTTGHGGSGTFRLDKNPS